jgi:hypothetical protein
MLEPLTYLVLFSFREGKWIRPHPPITHRPERGERTILMARDGIQYLSLDSASDRGSERKFEPLSIFSIE